MRKLEESYETFEKTEILISPNYMFYTYLNHELPHLSVFPEESPQVWIVHALVVQLRLVITGIGRIEILLICYLEPQRLAEFSPREHAIGLEARECGHFPLQG